MMKKIIGLTLALVMMLSMVQITVSADTTAGETRNTFYVHFDSYEVGAVYDSTYLFDTTNPAQNGSIGRGKASTTSIVERSTGNNALKFVTSGVDASDSVNIHFGSVDHTMSDGDILHWGFDFMTEDMNYQRSVWLRAEGSWKNQNFITFGKDGIIKFDGAIVQKYDLNTWYDIDFYYEHSTKRCHLFINDNYAMTKSINYISTKFNFLRLNFGLPVNGDASSVFYVDNLLSDYATTDELNTLLPEYYTGFNTKSAGSNMLSGGYFGGNEITGKSNTISLGDNTKGTVTAYQKNVGDMAAKIVIPTDETKNVYVHTKQTVKIEADTAVHFGFDFMAEDFNTTKTFVTSTTKVSGNESAANRYDNWNLLKFNSNGTITSYGDNNVIGVYTLNTWYNIDVYYDCTEQKNYIFINDELRYVSNRDGNYNSQVEFAFARLWLNKNTTVYLDDVLVDKIPASELASLVSSSAPSVPVLTASKNAADNNKLFVRAAAPEALSGRIVVALYNGNELVEVIPYNAEDRKYITFTQNGNDVKVMWLNGTDGDVTPKVKAIPVSFVAGN